ncbi:hypothetical protein DIJ61_07255 [Burkholderia pseudomallei]|nr:hypothetical protein DIJ62_35835 [Burkholderia pseudomallei]TPA29954.1 hypothetical protein DIJ61_07255 [Burkholderia pseudomallei]
MQRDLLCLYCIKIQYCIMDNSALPGHALFMPKLTKPCWTCEHWSGYIAGGDRTAVCSQPGAEHVRSTAIVGCAFWVRAIGLDDLTDEACDDLVRQFQPEYQYPKRSRSLRG